MEEEVGFEPTEPLRVQRFSRPARSTTPALFLLVLSAKSSSDFASPILFLYIKLKIFNCKVIFYNILCKEMLILQTV